MRLPQAIAQLRRLYGKPTPPKVTDPLELLLFENVAYLVDDDVRSRVWAAFKKAVGADAKKILRHDDLRLCQIIEDGGLRPLMRVRKVKEVARIALDECAGDLRAVLKRPPKESRRILKKFPGIGDPGADKVFLFTRTHAVPALESNGVRVMVRLGFGAESDAYPKQYRAAIAALTEQLPPEFGPLIDAYLLLRQHGQTLCTRKGPACEKCPLADLGCPVGRRPVGVRDWPK